MDVLRTAASLMGCLEPELEPRTVDCVERLIGVFASALMYWHHASRGAQRRRGTGRGGLSGSRGVAARVVCISRGPRALN